MRCHARRQRGGNVESLRGSSSPQGVEHEAGYDGADTSTTSAAWSDTAPATRPAVAGDLPSLHAKPLPEPRLARDPSLRDGVTAEPGDASRRWPWTAMAQR